MCATTNQRQAAEAMFDCAGKRQEAVMVVSKVGRFVREHRGKLLVGQHVNQTLGDDDLRRTPGNADSHDRFSGKHDQIARSDGAVFSVSASDAYQSRYPSVFSHSDGHSTGDNESRTRA
jgi:hypothetical protein